MSREVWAVSSGEYDSWTVNCLFEIEADAHAAVAAGVGENVEPYAYRLYASGEMPRQVTMYEASATVTTDQEYAARYRWMPDRAPKIEQLGYRWTHLESGEVELCVTSNEARLFGRAISDDSDAALNAVTEWQRQQRATLDD